MIGKVHGQVAGVLCGPGYGVGHPPLTIVMIGGAALAMNSNRTGALTRVIDCSLDGQQISDDPNQPGITGVLPLRHGGS